MRVVPPSGAKVEIVAESPISAVMPADRIEGNSGPSYHGEYTGRSPLRLIPLPTTGRLHISVHDGHPNPFRMTVPITVWPSVSTLVLWWVVAILGVLGTRWQSALATSDSPFTILTKVRDDASYLLELLVLGVLVVIPLRIIGWLLTLADPGDANQ